MLASKLYQRLKLYACDTSKLFFLGHLQRRVDEMEVQIAAQQQYEAVDMT